MTLTLWGVPHSLYTGKVRSYLIKKGLPILETSDGKFIQDSTVIIEELEHRFPERPMVPATPVQRVVATLLGGFGSEGLLSVAMHYRWTERMNLAAIADGEFPEQACEWFPDDAIPATLEPIIRLMFQDWGIQLLADADFVNDWLQANPDVPSGRLVSADEERRVHPVLGEISAPHGLWHFERGASLARELQGDARVRFDALVERLAGSEVMQVRTSRPMRREDDALVFA